MRLFAPATLRKTVSNDLRREDTCSTAQFRHIKFAKNSGSSASSGLGNRFKVFNLEDSSTTRHNNGTVGQWTNKQCKLAFVADFLTTTEISNISGTVATYQTALSR